MCSKKFAKTVPDSTGATLIAKIRDVGCTFLGVACRVEPPYIPEIYKTLEQAEIAAAKIVYKKTKEAGWKQEYGIGIHGNGSTIEDSNEFILTKRISSSDDKNGVSILPAMTPIKPGYSLKAFVHSHPTDPPYIFANEFSGHDYYQALNGYEDNPLTFYLVINVGENGTLIRFTPPTEKISTAAWDIAKDNYKRNNTASVVISRKDKVEFVNTMLKERGELKETPITAESIHNNTLGWKRLSPEIVLWKSAATDIIISFENNDYRKRLSDIKKEIEILRQKEESKTISPLEHNQLYSLYGRANNLFDKLTLSVDVRGERPMEDMGLRDTYDGRKFTYDLKNTQSNKSSINKVIIKDDIGVINITTGQPEIIGYGKFGGYIDVLGITTDKLSLYVPKVCCDAYRKASGWKDFKEILPLRNWETL
jgi:hypothetical protein